MEKHDQCIDRLDYATVLSKVDDQSIEAMIGFLLEELPYLWYDAYVQMTPRQTSVCRFTHGTFEYIFDDYVTLESTSAVPHDQTSEARLMAVLGRSNPVKRARDDCRLRGWVGKAWDKGHFIAHSIGGAVDGIEANVFVQKREVNRGWSASGKRFREMEQYCFSNPGTFCFNRPFYTDNSARPAFFEFGLLKSNKEFWIECFDNR